MKGDQHLVIFSKRLPNRSEIIPVFATIIFLIYSWTISRLFWKLPNWMLYQDGWDIFYVTVYALAFALLESLTILTFILLLTFLLPSKALKEKFTAKGSAIVWMIGVFSYLAQINLDYFRQWGLQEFIFYTTTILILSTLMMIVLPHFLVDKFPSIENFLTSLAIRLVIFLYIYFPLGVVSLFVMILRNVV